MKCSLCKKAFEKKGDEVKHMKSFTHQQRVAAVESREQLRLQEQLKQDKLTAKKERLDPVLTPVVEKYLNSMYATMGNPLKEEQSKKESGDDLQGTLSDHILRCYAASRPRKHVVARRKAMYKLVYRVCRTLYPECQLSVYGSIPHQLDGEDSDIDMSIRYEQMDDVPLLVSIAWALEEFAGDSLRVSRVLKARIPLIGITDTLCNLQLDLSPWKLDKLQISTIFTRYFELDQRIRPLTWAIRRIAKSCDVCDAYSGYINSFGWTVSVVAYATIQGCLPALEDAEKPFQSDNDTELGDLLLGFYRWMFREFNYERNRISLRHVGCVVPKESEKFDDNTYLCVERPRTPYQNITRQVEKRSWAEIKSKIERVLKTDLLEYTF